MVLLPSCLLLAVVVCLCVNRVLELHDFVDKHRRQLSDLLQRSNQDDYDDHDMLLAP